VVRQLSAARVPDAVLPPSSTTFSGADAGDTIRFAFDGAWDVSTANGNPNWQLTGMEIRV
jgi:hypothetical protein